MASLKQTAAEIEQKAQAKLARGSVALPLPLYGGAYGARFRVLAPERLAEFEQLQQREDLTSEEIVEAAAELVGDMCAHIGRVSTVDGKSKIEKLEHDDGRPVRFDQEFAQVLKLEPPDDRERIASMADVVLAVWSVEDEEGRREVNTSALNVFAIKLLQWCTDTMQHVQGELAGG